MSIDGRRACTTIKRAMRVRISKFVLVANVRPEKITVSGSGV